MQTLAELLKLIDRTPAGCWEWKGPLDRQGRGRVYPTSSGRSMVAHRAVWIAARGPIPSGMVLCHRCDNQTCCNPGHIFIGSQKRNMEDARMKGRTNRGAKNGRSLLNAEQVREIRDFLKRGEPAANIALRYGVAEGTIGSIRSGRRWKWLQ